MCKVLAEHFGIGFEFEYFLGLFQSLMQIWQPKNLNGHNANNPKPKSPKSLKRPNEGMQPLDINGPFHISNIKSFNYLLLISLIEVKSLLHIVMIHNLFKTFDN